MRVDTYPLALAPLDDFFAFAEQLYAGDPYYVKRREVFPANATVWICRSGEEIVARCATFEREDLPGTLFFGWYESIEELTASQILIEAVISDAWSKSFRSIIGPLNGTTWQQYRFAEDSGETFMGDVYHKPWYDRQMRAHGFSTCQTYHSSSGELTPLEHRSAVKIRNLESEAFEDELRLLHDISLRSFDRNAFYTPISLEHFSAMYSGMRALIDPRLVKIALLNDEPAGFMFAYPDRFAPHRLVMKTVAVLPEYRGRGVSTAMDSAIRSTALSLGYWQAVYALYEANNVSARLAKASRVLRTYHLYDRLL
jgi:GNAT superfamily N-acetyltransferase